MVHVREVIGTIDKAAWGRISEALEERVDEWAQVAHDEWRREINRHLMRVLHREDEGTVLIEVVSGPIGEVVTVAYEDLARVAEDEIYVYYHIIELMQKTPV